MKNPPGPDRVSRPTPSAVAPAVGRRRYSSRCGAAPAVMLLVLAGCIPPGPPPQPPEPTPTPTPAPTPEPTPPPEEQCHLIGAVCDCWHMPPGSGWEFLECEPTPEPTPPPEPGVCPYQTFTAQELEAAGYRVEIRPEREGGLQIGATPFACWPEVDGQNYYCQPGMWPEACAGQRQCGPVVPDGHPARIACEQYFLGQPCAYFTYTSDTHMSFDPFVYQDGQNRNHPRNVEACGQAVLGDDPSWVKVDGYVQAGQWSWATAHGNGTICAEAAEGAGKHCMDYVE